MGLDAFIAYKLEADIGSDLLGQDCALRHLLAQNINSGDGIAAKKTSVGDEFSLLVETAFLLRLKPSPSSAPGVPFLNQSWTQGHLFAFFPPEFNGSSA